MTGTGAAAPLPPARLPFAPLTSASGGEPAGWRAWAGRAGALLLGLVLLVATAAKALDPQGFAETMQREGLTFGLPPMAAALVALAVEAALGLALLLGVRRRPVLVAAAGLVTFFVLLNARAWWVAAHGGGEEASCGCFGNLVQRTPAEAFWQDLVLLVTPLLLAFLGRSAPRAPLPRRRLLAAATGAAAVVLLAWRAPELPLDDVATRLRPGVELGGLCATLEDDDEICLADLVPELRTGRWQVVMVDLERSPERWADALNRYAESGAQPPLLALTGSASEQVSSFTWQWGPSYSLREVPAPLLRPLYRRLPRSFVSEDGRVVSTSPALPAPPAAVAAR